MGTSRTGRKRRSSRRAEPAGRAARPARHVRPPRRRRPTRWASAIVALGAIAGGSWLALSSSLFAVRRIEVHGNGRLTDARVARLAAVPASANLIRLSTAAVEARLEAHPWIAAATVRRTLPGTLDVLVRERGPDAAIRAGKGWALLAADGTVLGTRDRRPDLPMIGARVSGAAPGARLVGLLPPLRVLAHLPDAVPAVRARPDGEGSVVLVLSGGTRVRYGEAQGWEQKNPAIEALLAWADRHGVAAARIDVRVPQSPALAPAG